MELRPDEDGLKDQEYLGIDKELISGNVKRYLHDTLRKRRRGSQIY